MNTTLNFDILRQPDNTTCGPTCLHAVYRYFGDPISLEEVIEGVPSLQEGGTLAPYLACHALGRGYRTTIIPYNLQIFDPTWAGAPPGELATKLAAQLSFKRDIPGFEEVTASYLEYLASGGRLRFEVLTAALIRHYLKRGMPILTGLSATYLYRSMREYDMEGVPVYDDVRGESAGHFVVLSGYDRKERRVLVSDPYTPNRHYSVEIYRLVCAIMLGILTYDGNLLVIEKRR